MYDFLDVAENLSLDIVYSMRVVIPTPWRCFSRCNLIRTVRECVLEWCCEEPCVIIVKCIPAQCASTVMLLN